MENEIDPEVEKMKASITKEMVKDIAENNAPECFEASRPLTVALAQMLAVSMHQTAQLLIAFDSMGFDVDWQGPHAVVSNNKGNGPTLN